MPKPITDPQSLIAAGPSSDQTTLTIPSIADSLPINLGGGEVKTEPELTMDDFHKYKGDLSPDDPKVKEELDEEERKAKEATEKEEAAKLAAEEEEKKKGELPPTTKLPKTATTTQTRTGGDTEISGTDRDPVFQTFSKQMSKEARQWVEARLKERDEHATKAKELETALQARKDGELPAAWYDHPQAYSLLPEVRDAAQVSSYLKGILNHYQNQLISIKDGESWEDLIQDAQGNITTVKREKPTSADEVNVTNRIAEARQAIQNQENRVAAIVNNFKAKQQGFAEGMRKVEDYYFPQYSDPKSYEKDPDYLAVDKELQESHLNNDRLAPLLKKLYTWSMKILSENEELKSSVDKTKTIKEMQRRAGPTGSMINTGGVDLSKSNIDEIPYNPKMWPINR